MTQTNIKKECSDNQDWGWNNQAESTHYANGKIQLVVGGEYAGFVDYCPFCGEQAEKGQS